MSYPGPSDQVGPLERHLEEQSERGDGAIDALRTDMVPRHMPDAPLRRNAPHQRLIVPRCTPTASAASMCVAPFSTRSTARWRRASCVL